MSLVIVAARAARVAEVRGGALAEDGVRFRGGGWIGPPELVSGNATPWYAWSLWLPALQAENDGGDDDPSGWRDSARARLVRLASTVGVRVFVWRRGKETLHQFHQRWRTAIGWQNPTPQQAERRLTSQRRSAHAG